MSAEQEVRDLIDARVRAVAAKDAAAATSHHAPDITMFDVVIPLTYQGRDQVEQRTRDWFGLYDGRIGYEVRDVRVLAGPALAFCYYLYRVTGTLTGGTSMKMWVRATLCFRRMDGEWQLVHEHDSVPFDPDSGQAALDQEPQ